MGSLCGREVPPESTLSLAAASAPPDPLPKVGRGGQLASLGRVPGRPRPLDTPPHPCSQGTMNRPLWSPQ